ncbi:ribosomal maturation YjgA family protein [Bacillus sp. BP-3]|uniref:ribosomal maturation YjgA family protein n=1 Tax=Bacillus sp. BP-3 TaxID=3022773 RepID=UPI00232E1C87|nr:DUF2809 domain-containing protein [Bacillus sp. BP-3]MDC2864051.1 DUF2809 domain-containing protein [Bacillus sp. BP-3]
MTLKRNRFLYAMMTVIVIILGLTSRKIAYVLPHILNTYLGDALWALMIFIGFGFIFNRAQTKIIVLLAISFCYIIEFSQLYHACWIDHIRETTLGGLVLGYGFLWSDLLAYAIGIGIGVIIEMLFVLIRKPSNLI